MNFLTTQPKALLKNSKTCELSIYVKEHSDTGLCIKDVRSIMAADQEAQEQPIPQSKLPNKPVSIAVSTSDVTITSKVLSVLSGQAPLTATMQPVLVVTGSSLTTESILPVSVVTECTEQTATTQSSSLCMVTKQTAIRNCQMSLPVITNVVPATHDILANPLPMVTDQHKTSTQPETNTKWNRIMNRPVKADSKESDDLKQKAQLDDTGEHTLSTTNYEAMNLEQDDIFYMRSYRHYGQTLQSEIA